MSQFPLGMPPPPGVASPPMSMAALMAAGANGSPESLAAAATAAAAAGASFHEVGKIFFRRKKWPNLNQKQFDFVYKRKYTNSLFTNSLSISMQDRNRLKREEALSTKMFYNVIPT